MEGINLASIEALELKKEEEWSPPSTFLLLRLHSFHNLLTGSIFHKDSSQNNIIQDCKI